MNVSLTPKLEHLIKKKVASGRYHSASEVVREALRLFEETEIIRVAKLTKLKEEIRIGVRQADRDETQDGRKVFERIRKRH